MKHYQAILKRVVNRLWDSLSNRDRDIIAADVERETPLAQWFDKTILSEATAKYESPTYWMNEPFSFAHSSYEDNQRGLTSIDVNIVVAPAPETPKPVKARKARKVKMEMEMAA